MKIKQAEFVKSAPTIDDSPSTGYPEFAFAGRSNVGKSSLINYIVNRKKLARTSSAPGRTQMLNYYLINEAFYFVDLPGYGYAKVSQTMRQKWRQEIDRYLTERRELRGVIQVVDIRHDASELDIQMANYIKQLDIPWLLVLTKADKLSKAQQSSQAQKLSLALGADNPKRRFVISSEKRFGGELLINELANLI